MVNSLKKYNEVQHCYYDVKDNLDKVNEYYIEIRRVIKKIYDISGEDIYAAYKLYDALAYELKLEFKRLYGDVFGWYELYNKRYDQDLEMIEKYDPERAKRLKKGE